MLVNRLFKEKKYKNIYEWRNIYTDEEKLKIALDYLNYLNNLSEQLS